MSQSEEVKQAVGMADEDAEIARLEAELAQPSEREAKQRRLAELEAGRAAKRLAQGKAVAERRRVGIKRAAGSLADQMNQDAQRFIAAVEAVVAAVETMNERYEEYEKYRAEAAALADRFGLDASALVPAVDAPAVRAEVVAAYDALHGHNRGLQVADRTERYKPQVEQDEHGLRQRRTFAEIAGTPGYEIITEAGLAPWPELTERQREIVAQLDGNAAAASAQAKENADMLAAELGRIAGRVGPNPRPGA